jgi:hypothetical protein
MHMPKHFTKYIKEKVWLELQQAVKGQLAATPGEYDVIALIDGIAYRGSRQYGVSYDRIAIWLEARYNADGTESQNRDNGHNG